MTKTAATMPDYLSVPPERLGEGGPVRVEVCGGKSDVARRMAEAILGEIVEAGERGRAATLILPVGPVDQYPLLAAMINERRIDCREVVIVNMDEYLDEGDRWLDPAHPLSFRGYMDRKFFDLVDPELAPRPENRVFPRPDAPEEVGRLIEECGGVDACFGGIGINCHMAFNEPPEPGEIIEDERFAALPTRVLNLSRETKTVNSITVGGDVTLIPRRCVTVGMKEILESRRLRFFLNRPWQSAVVRRVLHGPITAACPASFLRTHGDAALTIAEYVAALPDIRLR